jgi:hypothetical protein
MAATSIKSTPGTLKLEGYGVYVTIFDYNKPIKVYTSGINGETGGANTRS